MPAHILQRFPFAGGGLPLWQRLRGLLSRGFAGDADPVSLKLGAGQELRLHDAAGWTVACRSGSLWITQEADTRDVFLRDGERFTADRDGLTLVLARKDALLAIRPPAGGPRRGIAARVVQGPAPDSAREVWLRAVYPECGPWNDPAAFRRSGLL